MSKTVTLSRYQARVMWHLSQGNTPTEVAGIIGADRQSVTSAAVLVRAKLNARTNTQAVLLCYQLGLIGRYSWCGDRRGYLRHMETDDPACPACRRANLDWVLLGPRVDAEAAEPEPLDEVHVRLLKALHGGRTKDQIMQAWGVGRSRLTRTTTEMYRRLGVSHLPRDLRREAAFKAGQKQGYLGKVPPQLPPPPVGAGSGRLTDLEVYTLKSLEDRSLRQAAEYLGIERSSVSSRLHHIYVKLAVNHLPREDRRKAALKEARNQGYPI